MKIYHNPRCRKSRETLEILKANQIDPEIRLYLTDTFDKEELETVLKMLGISAFELVRKNELLYKENYKAKTFTEKEWIEILLDNPRLIERPIVVSDGKAVLGRPPENVQELL